MRIHNAPLNGDGLRIAIVAGRFNDAIVNNLVDGASDRLVRLGVADDNIDLFWVPGAFEIPIAAQSAARSGRFDAVVGLGVVIRGATPHFDYVCSQAAAGCAAVGMETGVPAIFGVLTTETIEQAIERAGTKAGNKGADSAEAAIEMVHLLRLAGKGGND